MVSFQHKLEAGLYQRGVQVCHDLKDTPYQAVLVIGGARDLPGLWRARRSGIPIVQRLDGMNWLHRKVSSSWRAGRIRHFLRAEYGNLVLSTIRRKLANHLIYQSQFVLDWWERRYGPATGDKKVIYNGVDLSIYTPDGLEKPPQDRWRILMVEGSLMGGYEQGLIVGLQLLQQLYDAPGNAQLAKPVELMVVGRVPLELQQDWQNRIRSRYPSEQVRIAWAGLVERESIPAIDRSAHLLYSADINAACPNSVIEALACGLPVVSFDTGALPELVKGDAGRIAPYGGDPWKLEQPDVAALASAAGQVLGAQEHFRRQARRRAQECFGLNTMVDAYLEVLL
jgi:glycosyltransferase involved in cell wall biosynthesis